MLPCPSGAAAGMHRLSNRMVAAACAVSHSRRRMVRTQAQQQQEQQQQQQEQQQQQQEQKPQTSLKPPKIRREKPPPNLYDREGSPFLELGLKDVMEGMGRVRVRQHVNPLSSQFQQPPPQLDWRGPGAPFRDPTLPLFVDLGCGPGRFLLLLSRQRQQQPMNYLGLEIRQPLVERANKWAAELGVAGQVHYLFTNVSTSLGQLLQGYPGPITTLSAQFPDPQFKARHKKRRMVQASVVAAARDLLAPGGHVFLQSDVYDAAVSMRDEFEQHAGDVLALAPQHSPDSVFHWTWQQEQAALLAEAAAALGDHSSSSSSTQPQQQHEAADGLSDQPSSSDGFVSQWQAGGWLTDNPLQVPTEREHYVNAQGGRVFRVLLVKK